MLNITKELKTKLLAAESAEEVTELIKADGQEITAEDAVHLWEEIERKRNADGKELSLDELDAITGGRDWPTQGCAATVEPGSDCWFGTDFCYSCLGQMYENAPVKRRCGVCNYYPLYEKETFERKEIFVCKQCGAWFVRDYGTDTVNVITGPKIG